MAIKLHLLVEIYLYMVSIAAQVVASQIDQHHMLGVLLWVVHQGLCALFVDLHVAGAKGGTGNRVDAGVASGYLAVGLR